MSRPAVEVADLLHKQGDRFMEQSPWLNFKRGNRYLRKLFVQCARAVLQQKTKQSSGLKAWLEKLTSRTHRNVAAVALANKLARMAWAVLATGQAYRAPLAAAA